jgi:transposase
MGLTGRGGQRVLVMNSDEQLRLDIIAKIVAGKMGRKEGQRALCVSERTVRRHLKEYLEKGPLFVKHGNYKKTPANLTDPELKRQVQELVREKYFDFNLTHCLEKLKQDHGIAISHDTLRRWAHEIGMVKRAKRRTAKVRRRRDRMAQTGVMLQMDGSPHAWFDGKESCLIAAIDDADSEVPFGEFFPSEDTLSCMKVIQKIIEKKGLFQILYVDRAGIFGGPKRANFSQLKRALEELGIHIIFANSPEAKGRIERLWETLQDRLIPEMRLRGIRSYERANDFLQNQFLPNEYAAKFKVVPENLVPGYRSLPPGIDLNEVFCLKEERMCARDHTFGWGGETYRIDSELKNSIYKQKIQIRTYQDLTWKAFFAGKEIKVAQVKTHEKQQKIAPIEELHGLKVRRDGHIEYQGRYYSVEEQFIGTKVSVTESAGTVLIHQHGNIIERHAKASLQGQLASTKPHHLSPWKKALEINSSYRRAARFYGASVEEFVVAVINRGYGVVDTAAIWGVMGFDKTYTAQAINEACKTALELEQPTYRAVKVLLKLQPTRHEQRQQRPSTAAAG